MMTQANKIKLSISPTLTQALQVIIAKQTQNLLGQSSSVSVENKTSPTGMSLKVAIKANGAIAKEFGTLKTPARPWFSSLKKQMTPALSSILSSHLKLKK